MHESIEAGRVSQALIDQWGADAVETEQSKVYIQFIDEVVVSLEIDCDLGVSHCVAELPNVFPPSAAPKSFEDLCTYANRLNITLSRELGVNHHFQVLDDVLKLTDTRPFKGTEDIVESCDAQARELISLMGAVTQGLLHSFAATEEAEEHIPANATFA